MIDRRPRFVFSAAAIFLLALASASTAQTKSTGTARYRLVRAQCTTGPCNASYAFVSGSVQVKWPKRAKRASEGKIGNVNLKTVAIAGGSVGTLLPDSLTAELSGTRIFGDDPTADCPLANTVQSGVFGRADVGCFDSSGSLRCNGDLFFDPMEDPACRDVDMIVQDVDIAVTPDSGAGVDTAPLARFGRAVVGEVEPLPLTENTSGDRQRLVQAMCSTGPCAPGYSFTAGIATMKRTRYSKLAASSKLGRIKLKRLRDAGDVAPTGVEVEVRGHSYYGADPTSDCPVAGSNASEVFATASLPCKPSGKCVGDLLLALPIDPDCTDVDWVIEDIGIDVYELGMAGVESSRIASNGKALLAD